MFFMSKNSQNSVVLEYNFDFYFTKLLYLFMLKHGY